MTEPKEKVSGGCPHGLEWYLLWEAPSTVGTNHEAAQCWRDERCCVNLSSQVMLNYWGKKCYMDWLDLSCYIWWLWIPRPPIEQEHFYRGINSINNNNNNNENSITVIILIAGFIVCFSCWVVRHDYKQFVYKLESSSQHYKIDIIIIWPLQVRKLTQKSSVLSFSNTLVGGRARIRIQIPFHTDMY